MSQIRKRPITLKGSADIVVEFFEYAVNSILYQRGLYPPEDFKMARKYNLSLMVCAEDDLRAYLAQIFSQLEKWLLAKNISKFVLVISNRDTREVVERWQFDIELERTLSNSATTKENEQDSVNVTMTSASVIRPKSEKEIHQEISSIIRQITSSVTFLPTLEPESVTFNVLVYTDKNAEVPATWIDSDPRMITHNAEQVKLKSFSTSLHKVDSLVAYRTDE